MSEYKEKKGKSKAKAKKKKGSDDEYEDNDQGSLKIQVETFEGGDEEDILNEIIDIILKGSKIKTIPTTIISEPTDLEEFKQQIQDGDYPEGNKKPKNF